MSAARPAVLLLGDTLIFGGTEGQFVELACGLDPARWEIHVSCISTAGELGARFDAAGIRVWRCGRGPFKSPRFALSVWGLARFLRARRIRLIHCFGFYSNVLGVLAARLAGVPTVIASQRELGDIRPLLQRSVQALALRMADRVVVNSTAVAERLQRHRTIDPARMVMIPNGVDLTRFSSVPVRRSHPERLTVGALAVLRPEKGLADFVRAAALVHERVAGARFAVWGDGPERAPLERLAATLGLNGAIEFRGSTAQPEVALRELDIFVLPSLTEAFSNGLLEAMATGLPVVATRVGGNPGLVDDGTTGLLVPPGDAGGLAKAIIRLSEDPRLADRLGATGRELVRARFGLDRMLAQVQALYEHALTGGVSSGRGQVAGWAR
jgi:glycosyltransferase involved in cell wall biosynthesis